MDYPNPELRDEEADRLLEELKRKHPMKASDDRPSVLEMAKNFTHSMANWAKGGFGKVPEHVHASRLATCQGCEYWRGKNFNGLGQCMKCGCTGAKLWLPNDQCPLLKWGKHGSLAIFPSFQPNVLTEKSIEINLSNSNESKGSRISQETPSPNDGVRH